LALLKEVSVSRAPNFLKREYRCLNCRAEIIGGGNNIYSKRFCSEQCKLDYLI
jgi:hypothetical protein